MSAVDTAGARRFSILGNLAKADIRYEPFPQLVIENALPEEVYSELEAAFPTLDAVAHDDGGMNNYAYLLSAFEVIGQERFARIWDEFFGYHTSKEFFEEFVAVFGDSLRTLYPAREPHWGKTLDEIEVVRRTHKWEKSETGPVVEMDVQFGLNSPVREPTSVRGPHVDSRYKLFNALLYFRDPADDCHGGHIQFYKYRNGRPVFQGKQPPESALEMVNEVRYARNSLVLFVNSPHAVHGVSPRSVTPFTRRYVNFSAECYDMPNDTLFDRPQSRFASVARAAELVRSGQVLQLCRSVANRVLAR